MQTVHTGEGVFNLLRAQAAYAALKPWVELSPEQQEAFNAVALAVAPIVADPNIKIKMNEGFDFLNQAAKRASFQPMSAVLTSVKHAYSAFETVQRLMEES